MIVILSCIIVPHKCDDVHGVLHTTGPSFQLPTLKFRRLWILSVALCLLLRQPPFLLLIWLKPRLYMAWRNKLLAFMAGLCALQLLALLWCAGKYM